ncbi:MAG: helix-turn-helix domain-containing protein [Nannocystis sp.]|uniref:AlkA N-terminal domain-containing protein n=1 Tax=Nannocystis sp. TaxID=1962667 RepID=UPI002427BA0D|nr:AlkA N-terminal domain-containing protein [Nannocystis sp.]MBK9752524.1 helix-turn-helix domain-containing protein [Nannocystis sp.]
MLDRDACYAALAARDARFDGLFFVGVATTGIYCRPVCSARTPRRDRCTFYRSSAEAERAGHRACLRCRPELAPGAAPQDAVPRLVAGATALIDHGYLNEHGVDALARTLGVSARHLRRATEDMLGVSPIELAQSRRLALAKQLLHDSTLPITELAHASGFRSVRRFNALFQARFGRPPSELRRAASTRGPALALRLDLRPPFDWPRLLAFLAARAIPGVEHIDGDIYRRIVHLGGHTGPVCLRPDPHHPAIRADIDPALAPVLMPLVARLRRLLDLDAHPAQISAVLARDPRLAPLLRRRPGLRVPGAIDPFEAAARAVLGQQVSVRAATTLAGRLVARFGLPLAEPLANLTHRFPTAAEIADIAVPELAAIGLPQARAAGLQALARAFTDEHLAGPHQDPEHFAAALTALPGVGDWTAQYLVLRALHHPDGFPAGDLVLRKALGGRPERAIRERAEAWRPWRAYAVLHLWTEHNESEHP